MEDVGWLHFINIKLVQAEDAFWEALTTGKTDFSVRLRYEKVKLFYQIKD